MESTEKRFDGNFNTDWSKRSGGLYYTNDFPIQRLGKRNEMVQDCDDTFWSDDDDDMMDNMKKRSWDDDDDYLMDYMRSLGRHKRSLNDAYYDSDDDMMDDMRKKPEFGFLHLVACCSFLFLIVHFFVLSSLTFLHPVGGRWWWVVARG